MAHKSCSVCDEVKPLTEFYRNKDGADGYRTDCKVCGSIGNKEYAEINKEKLKVTRRAYRTTNPARATAMGRLYREKNKEKVLAAGKQYYQNNKDRLKPIRQAWSKENRHKTCATTAKYRASKLQATPLWANLRKIEGWYKAAKLWGMTVDHIIPLQGFAVCGLHVHTNMQMLTHSQNCSKSNNFTIQEA